MGIEEAVHIKEFDVHSNDNRTIVGLLNPTSEKPMKIEQVRVVKVHKESVLGNHWREYGEIYGVVGEAEFTLEDIDTKKRKICCMKTGDTLYVPKRVALKVKAPSELVVICCSEENKREQGTHRYEIKD